MCPVINPVTVSLDNAYDKYVEEAQQLQQNILSRVNKMFDEYFTDIAKKSKDGKRKIEVNTTSISDRLDFLEYLLKLLKSLNSSTDTDEQKVKYISTFHRVKENMAKILKYTFSETTVVLTSDIHKNVKNIADFNQIGTVSITEIPISKVADISTAEFSLLSKYDVEAAIRGGTVLRNGNLLCMDQANSRCVLLCMNQECLENTIVATFSLKYNPWDILLDNGKFYISNNQPTGLIEQFSADNFASLPPICVGRSCYGLAIIGDVLFAVSDCCYILKLSVHRGSTMETIYKTESRGLRYLTGLADGEIVCSNFTDHYVIALDEMGNEIWTYKHAKLKGPYGVDKDSQSNIYVAGRKSNNIHVVSRQGSLLRILEGNISPVCLKFKNGTSTAFVICHKQLNDTSQMMLFQFK